jgi:hypothetical protein
MGRIFAIACALVALLPGAAVALPNYSTGAVDDYGTCGLSPDLPLTIPEAANFRGWFNFGGFPLFTRWTNGDVWGSDFRDAGSPNDRDAGGGSDVPGIYFFSGHGVCQNPPIASSPDFLVTCGNFGKPDFDSIGASSRWGSIGGGNSQFMFLDASCPMDLVSLTNVWFPPFQGLHVAVGHSGDVNHDTLDSSDRGGQFAAYNVGLSVGFLDLIPRLSVGDAWMVTGLVDVQNGVCAVALAAGNDRNDAIDRREHEKVRDNRTNPTPNWFAWKWICR